VSYAHWYAGSRGFRIGDGASGAIEGMADYAITEIFGPTLPDTPTPQQLAQLGQAEGALKVLIDTMIEGSGQIAGYSATHPNVIGEDTFAYAQSKLCPLFPIC
jgi:hypothetical protein